MNLNAKTVAGLVLVDGKTDMIFFDEMPGFGYRLRAGSNGKVNATWIAQYRHGAGQRRMTIGPAAKIAPAAARAKAKEVLAQAALGNDPAGAKRERREKDQEILRSIIGEYIDHKEARPNSLRLARHYLLGPLGKRAKEQGLKPFLAPLHGKPIDVISRRDVARILLHVAKASGVPTALGLRGALSALFSWCMQAGLIEHNPVIGAYKPARPKARERVLDNEEIVAVWRALDDMPKDYAAIVRLLLCTSCRAQEIGSMQYGELRPDLTAWTLPAERSKNGRAHTLPLTPLMKEIIQSVPKRGNDYLFGRKGFNDWSGHKRALDARLKLKPWTLHDLRRSAATGMADLKIAPHIIEEILNHRSGHRAGVASVYNKSSYTDEVVSAMLRWSDHITALVEGREGNIVALKRA